MKRLALVLASAVLLVGCGDAEPTPTAGEAVPALATRLERVDGLIADRSWTAARAELRGIIAAANSARTAGDLDVTAADRVVASAQRLLAALPKPAPSPTVTPTPTQAVPPAGDGQGGEGKGGDKGKDDEDDDKGDKGGDKGKGKKGDD